MSPDPAAREERKIHPLLRRFLIFERGEQPLLTHHEFRHRMLRNFLASSTIILASLGIGVVGYHVTAGMGWLDALYNASMILTGMGPADQRPPAEIPAAEKWFASAYALFSGVVFLVSVGVLIAPVLHRAIHHFHLELEDDGPSG